MSQNLIYFSLAAGILIFLGGTLYLSYSHRFKYDNYIRQSLSQIYLQNNIFPNMLTGLNIVEQKPHQLNNKDNVAYWEWNPEKSISTSIQFEFVPITNMPNRIIFRSLLIKADKKDQTQNLDINSAYLLAKNYWIAPPDKNRWKCNENSNKSTTCLAYIQNNSGKNGYQMTDYNKYFFSVSCFIPKKSPLYAKDITCPPI